MKCFLHLLRKRSMSFSQSSALLWKQPFQLLKVTEETDSQFFEWARRIILRRYTFSKCCHPQIGFRKEHHKWHKSSFLKKKTTCWIPGVNRTQLIHLSIHLQYFCWSELVAQSLTDPLSLSQLSSSHEVARKTFSDLVSLLKNSSYYSERTFTELESALSKISQSLPAIMKGC